MEKIDWKQYGRIVVYIDNANLIHSPSEIGWKVGLEKLALFFRSSASLVDIKLFDSIPLVADLDGLRKKYPKFFSQNEHDMYELRSLGQQRIFAKAQSKWGITVITKPLRLIADFKKRQIIPKGDCDIDMVVDMIRKRKNYDTAILIAGDGDYVALVEYLKDCQKKVIVMSDRGLIAKILVDVATEYWPFTKYRSELEII